MSGRLQTSPDGGNTWNPVSALRTTQGGPDTGQTYKPSTGKVAISNSLTTTVALGTVTTGKTWFLSDLEFDLSASNCDVSIKVGGVTVWQRFLQTAAPITSLGRGVQIVAQAGQAVTLVFGTSGTGTPNAYFNLGAWEQ